MRSVIWLFISTLLYSLSASAFTDNNNFANNSLDNTPKFLPVDEAFPLDWRVEQQNLIVEWFTYPGYYLYQNRMTVEGVNVEIGEWALPEGKPYQDEFFGEVTIYQEAVKLSIPILSAGSNPQVKVSYQGCAEAGFCYPPETRTLDLAGLVNSIDTAPPPTKTQQTDTGLANQSKEQSFASQIAEQSWAPLVFLLLGVGLAFTPCVLPMYPILTSILLGGKTLSRGRTFYLAFIYVQGMALTYTLLGLIVASLGVQFQAMLQHPYVLITLSTLFVLLALSMFGAYTLQLPSSVQTWLNQLSDQQKGGSSVGVFTMGAISGLVCSPCTTAPLSGVLLFVAQSGDLVTGGITLYALALGMGIPLIAAGVFGQQLLPKAGPWMIKVKVLFGFLLLTAPLFFLERLLPEYWITPMWGALGVAAFGWLYYSKKDFEFGSWKQSAVGIIAMLGIVASSQPSISMWMNSSQNDEKKHVSFIQVDTLSELNAQLAQAKSQNKPVMFDLYADWCVACKEFEKYTFSDPKVAQSLDQFTLLQIDVTKNLPEHFDVMGEYQVLGLPTILFWDQNGNLQEQLRITGFVEAEPFFQHLQPLLPSS